MGIRKIISNVFVFGLFLVIAACGPKGVPQEEYDDVIREYNELKQAVEDAKDHNLNQAVVLNQTLSDLAQISGATEIIRSDIENGSAKLSQAEQISKNIVAIKKRINDLESRVDDDSYVRMVRNLKIIVREKEKEIEDLKRVIQDQRGKIKEQEGMIDEQNEKIGRQTITISVQEEQLRRTVANQATLLNQAGRDFESMGDDIPDVSRKKNKNKVESWAASMYSMAIVYYKRAQEYGHQQSANDIQRVQNKLYRLRH